MGKGMGPPMGAMGSWPRIEEGELCCGPCRFAQRPTTLVEIMHLERLPNLSIPVKTPGIAFRF